MQKFLIASLFLLSAFTANAQEIFSKGTQNLNVGIGFGEGTPIEVSYEYSILSGLTKDNNGAIGIGAYGGWYHHTKHSWSYNHYVLGVRSAFHYRFVEQLDTYCGVMLGYDIVSSSRTGKGNSTGKASGNAFDYSLFAGARYFFNSRLGVYAEAGYGVAFIRAGINFKF